MTDAQVEDHLDARQELEQERNYYIEKCAELTRELNRVNTELEKIKETYFRNN